MAEDVYHIVRRYNKAKTEFLSQDYITKKGSKTKINPVNKELVSRWLESKEKNLISTNGYDNVAQIRYCKTLYKELGFLKNVLLWFNHIELNNITEQDIEVFFIGLEKGTIKTINGEQLSNNTKKDYYTKVFRGKNTLFGFLGKNNLAQNVIIRKYQRDDEVRFFDFDTFQKIEGNAVLTSHKLAYWLLFDTGIEISALVQLRKSDFTKEYDPETKSEFYKLNIRNDISKKTRQKRYNYILQPKTNELLKVYFESLNDNDKLFNFYPPALTKALKLIVRKLNLKTKGDIASEITIKDFRSSCATYLLSLGYSTDFIKVRLGHKFSSDTIDRYVSYLGINQDKPRKEIFNLNYKELESKYNDLFLISEKQQNEINQLTEKISSQDYLINLLHKKIFPEVTFQD